MSTKSNTAPPSPRGSFWKTVALVCGSTLIFLGIIEGAIRLLELEQRLPQRNTFRFRPLLMDSIGNIPLTEYTLPTEREGRSLKRVQNITVYDRKLLWRLHPDAIWEKQGWFIITNSLGFRDREFQKEKPVTEKRILCLGDSVTFGWLLNEDDMWTTMLEQELNVRTSKVQYQVFNAGIYGYTSTQGLSLLQQGDLFTLKPDAAIIAYGLNDATGMGRALTDYLARDASRAPLILEKMALYRFLRKALLPLRDRILMKKSGQASRDFYRSNLSSMVQLLKDRNIGPVIMGEVTTQGLGHKRLQELPEYMSIAREIARQEKIPFIDLEQVFARYTTVWGQQESGPDEPRLYFLDSCHPTRLGCQIITRELAHVLEQEIFPSDYQTSGQTEQITRAETSL